VTQQDLKALNKAAARAAAALILCGAIVGAASAQDDSRAAVLDRIKPIGTVAISGAAQPAAPVATSPAAAEAAPAAAQSTEAARAEAAPAPSETTKAASAEPVAAPAETGPAAAPTGGAIDGKAIFMKVCFACHIPGVAGAPKLGDKEAWAPRIAQGKETLLQHALHGFKGKTGVMPPKGGATYLSDDEVSAAIGYMVSQAQ